MGSGDPPGLQNRRTASFGVVGGFDSHSLPPIYLYDNKLVMEAIRLSWVDLWVDLGLALGC
jgi:hypothetical protein